MLNQETKRRIDSARQILVGKIPDPKAQVEQITTAMIYKFMYDMDRENEVLGGQARYFTDDLKEFSWNRLLSKELSGQERMDTYTRALIELSKAKQIPELFRTIFKDAFLPYRDPETLNLFLKEINEFTYENSENLGNAFEYLLSVLGSQGDAGQFRTPRHVIDFIVEVVDPKKGETILDPACGTAGFLISAYKHIRRIYSSNFKEDEYIPTFAEKDNRDITTLEIQKNGKYKGDKLTPDDKKKLAQNIVGYDISPDMVRLSLVNLYLHDFNSPQIFEYDTLTYEDRWDDTFDVILANPPFMTPKGGIRPHKRFQVQANRAEVLFIDYIAEHLKIHGRAGIIVPEGIIFQSATAYKALRKMLVDNGLLWAVVSLPSGVFNPYSGVKTSILFLDKELAKKSNEVLFVKIENDGFDLGAQRRRIDNNDLPRAFEILKKFENFTKNDGKPLTHGDVKGSAHTVHKDEIAESGDYNLSGDRYKKEISIALRESVIRIEESLKPYQEMFKVFADQAEKYQKQIKEMQSSVQPFIRYIQDQQEAINELYQNLNEPIKTIQKAWENLNFSAVLETAKQLEGGLKSNQWPMVELGEVIEFLPKSKRKSGDGNDSGFYNFYVSSQTLIKKFDEADYKEESLILGTGGQASIHLDSNFSTSADTFVLKTKDSSKLLNKYLYVLLKSNLKLLEDGFKGGGLKHLSKEYLLNIQIPLPPLEIQEQIVNEVDSYQRVIDGATQVVESWKPSIKVDPEWERVEFSEVCAIDSKLVDPRENGYLNMLHVGGANIESFTGELQDLKTAKEENLISGKFVFDDSMVLYSKIRPYLVKVARPNFSGLCSADIYPLKPNTEKILKDYLYYVLISQDFTDYAIKGSDRVGMPKVNRNHLFAYQIPLPSLEEQKQIIAKIETEQKAIESNRSLILLFKEKVESKIGEIWGN